MRGPRVGFLIDRWDPRRGGAELCLARLADHLARQGCEVVVCAAASTAAPPGRFRRVPRARLLFGLARARAEARLARDLVAAARAERCDVTVGIRHLPQVDLFWPHAGAHELSLDARERALGRAKRGRLSPHQRLFVELERELLERGGARRVACVSALVQDELAALYPACRPRLELVPNGVDLEALRPEQRATLRAGLRAHLEVAPDEPLLLFMGREPVLKGLPALGRALAGLRERRWTLLVAGARPLRAVRALLRGVPRERLRLLAHGEPAELFAAADLLCLPTWRDTSSLALLEALAAGVPVLTTRRAGEARLVADARAGTVLEDPADEAGLRRALEAWLERIRSGDEEDRAYRRGLVLGRGLAPWLARLEALVRELAGSERAP